MQFKNKVLYDGLYTFVVQAAYVGLAFAVGLLTARVLGPTGKGIYAMPFVQAGLIATVFGGLSSTTSYYLLNEGAGRSVLRVLSLVTVVFVLAGSVAVFLIALLSHALWAAPAAIASLPAAATIAAVRGYVTGIKRVRYVSNISLALVVVTLLLTAAGLFLIERSPTVAIVAWVVAYAIVGAIAWAAMLIHARKLQRGNPVRFRPFFTMAIKGGATALISLLNYRADLYIVAIMLSARDLGLYSVATSAPQALLFPAQVAATVTSPHIGSLDRSAAAAMAARCSRHSLMISLVVCAVVFAFAPSIIGFFYGAAFLAMVPALRILLAGVVVLSLAGPISSYYTLKLAKPEVPLVIAGMSAVLCIALTFVLIPLFGIAGAACASTIAYAIAQIAALVYFRKGTGIGLRALLVPTSVDLRVYLDFFAQMRRDGARLLARSARPAG